MESDQIESEKLHKGHIRCHQCKKGTARKDGNWIRDRYQELWVCLSCQQLKKAKDKRLVE